MLKTARERKGLTQKELAKLTNLSQSYISKLERIDLAPQFPSTKQIAVLAKELNICPISLINYFLSPLIQCPKKCINLNVRRCNCFILKHY
ncbi:MAG: helix-turn-helix domain-containing protein [Sarcina sp.]